MTDTGKSKKSAREDRDPQVSNERDPNEVDRLPGISAVRHVGGTLESDPDYIELPGLH